MDEAIVEHQAKRLSFEEWAKAKEAKPIEVTADLWRGLEAEGWRSVSERRHTVAPGIELIKMLLQHGESPEGEAVAIDFYECEAAAAARQALLRALADVQSPLLAPDPSIGLGEIAFAMPSRTMLAFARANVAVLVRNAGRKVQEVTGAAREIDARLQQGGGRGGEKQP
jgi:hypothetical protein